MKPLPHSFFIISSHNLSVKSAGATRMRYYARALADSNNKVYIISCSSNKLLSDDMFVEAYTNVFILKVKDSSLSFLGTIAFLQRLKNFAEHKSGTKSFLLYPSVFLIIELLAIPYLKFYKKFKVFYELNEVRKYSAIYEAPMSIKRIVYSLKKIIFKILFTVPQFLLGFYDGLVCISTAMEKYGKKFNENTLRIPILTDPNTKIQISKNTYFNSESFNIGFSGSIHPVKEDLENFIAVIDHLNEEGHSISFNLCGSLFKSYREYFLDKCELSDKLNYYGLLNEMEMSTFLSQQDLLVIPRGFTLQNNYGFSTKLSDYLNHKKVVLVTDISDNTVYIEDGVNGFVVPPDNKQAMYEKIKSIIKTFDGIHKQVILNATSTSRQSFDYRLYTEQLRSFLK